MGITSARLKPEATGSRGASLEVVKYDPLNSEHRKGFAGLLIEQALAHGRELSEDHIAAMSNTIGREFYVSMIYGNGPKPAIVGMTTTSNAASAAGPICFLEDIVVTQSARNRGYGGQLMDSLLLNAWEGNKQGIAWETGRSNEEAAHLYLKIDPDFNVKNSLAVWSLSAENTAKLGKPSRQPHAELATDRQMTAMIRAAGDMDGFNHGYLANMLVEQKNNFATHNETLRRESENRTFALVANGGSFAIVSEGYSTFDAHVRADARLYLSPSCGPQHVAELIRGAAQEVSLRTRWQGSPMHVEFNNNTLGLDPARTTLALSRIGASVLKHNNDEMVPYSLHGERYVRAVMNAEKRLPERPRLSKEAKTRLSDALYQYEIDT